MRISADKVNKLAHTIADTLAETDECDFLEDRNTIRQEARKALEKLLAEETKLDASARLKIASQRKIILEGSPGVGHPLPQVLQRRGQEARPVNAPVLLARLSGDLPADIVEPALEKTSSWRTTMALWCNWLTRRPLKAESPGSSPGNATILLSII